MMCPPFTLHTSCQVSKHQNLRVKTCRLRLQKKSLKIKMQPDDSYVHLLYTVCAFVKHNSIVCAFIASKVLYLRVSVGYQNLFKSSVSHAEWHSFITPSCCWKYSQDHHMWIPTIPCLLVWLTLDETYSDKPYQITQPRYYSLLFYFYKGNFICNMFSKL